jgi:O-methyltransferase
MWYSQFNRIKGCLSGRVRGGRQPGKANQDRGIGHPEDPGHLYLDLMERCLTNWIYDTFDEQVRAEGRDWPTDAHTMIGLRRLDNVRSCVKDVLDRGIPGDFIETGVWRGGATILMRAILKAHGVTDRRVWVADSFEGLPPPNPEKYPHDEGDIHHTHAQLAISLEQVQSNFRRYGLLDDQVRFLKGWFRDTLPAASIAQLAVIRLDGDMYESTMDALTNLYPKLSVGGYAIVDDYGCIPACRQAVQDYRALHGIADQIHPIDWTGVYWRRSA